MKKVIGIFMAMVMVFLVFSVAFGSEEEEILKFCEENKNVLGNYMISMEIQNYNIVGDTAYAISNFGLNYTDMWDFMANYHSYLEEYWPDFANDVIIKYTYVGTTENYELICVWLELENGKLMSDYVAEEPAVTKISAIIACYK